MPSFFGNPLYLLGSFSVVAVAALAWFVWLRRKRKAAASKPPATAGPPESATDEGIGPVHAVLRAANARLKVSKKMKGASLSSLPVFLVVGPRGVGKTSAVVQSGLDPELLAGQLYQGAAIVPTTLNVWLARQVLFIEISEALATDAQAFGTILKYLRPARLSSATQKRQPPRAILLCADQKAVAEPRDPQQVAATARPWNQCLSLAAAALGTQLPVYVLLSKLDGVPGFPEFVSKLAGEDLEQAIGATMRPFDPASQGVYADETARLVDQHFTSIAGALCDSRVPLLIREQDHARIAVAYQFPRDFQKLQKNVVAFLVEIAKPSQLQVSAFLRGFYFAGTRQMALEPGDGRTPSATPAPARLNALGATVVLSQEQLKTQMNMLANPSQGARERTEWLFLSKLFEQVLLQDRSAHAVSTSSSRSDRARAIAAGLAGVLGVLFLFALTASYVRNRKLERDLAQAASGIQAQAPASLERLEQMRAPLDRLLGYRSHTPWTMRLGLHRGDELLPLAASVYCEAMLPILQPALDQMGARLDSMQSTSADPSANMGLFKAYLMMTKNPDKADAAILPRQLLDASKQTATGGSIQADPKLLEAQFRSYTELLSVSEAQSPCVLKARDGIVLKAQSYVCKLSIGTIYQRLLQRAGQGVGPVDYNASYKNNAVSVDKMIPGAFTKDGWKAMQALLNNPAFLKVEPWVCGDSKEAPQEDWRTEAAQIRGLYLKEYVQRWTEYLSSATIAPYKDLGDAAEKLETMAGREGLILVLVGVASENTLFDGQLKQFLPTKIVASSPTELYAKEYRNALAALKSVLRQAAQNRGATRDQIAQQVGPAIVAAETAVDQIADSPGFQSDIGGLVTEILRKPIKPINRLVEKQTVDAMNGAGRDLCTAFGHLAHRLPFASGAEGSGASPDDVRQMFQPERGGFWQFYKQQLSESLDCSSGAGCTRKANQPVPISEAFRDFFSDVDHWTHLLFNGGSQEVSIHLRVRALKYNNLRQLIIKVDDEPGVTLDAGGSDRLITWNGRPHKIRVEGVYDPESERARLFGPQSGPWGIFNWLLDAKSNGGEFMWRPTDGLNQPRKLDNGSPVTYKLQIQLEDGNVPLSLSLRACVAPTGR